MFRYAIAQVLFDPNELEQQQQPEPEPGETPAPEIATSGQATLFARNAHGSYEKATFSFEFALRDDPNNEIGNDWDLQYGNVPNHFHVAIVSDDRSRIVDLGQVQFEQPNLERLPALPAYPQPRRDFVPAVVGHVYLVHTADRNSDLYALFRVDSVNQNNSCDISWKRIPVPAAGDQ